MTKIIKGGISKKTSGDRVLTKYSKFDMKTSVNMKRNIIFTHLKRVFYSLCC